VLFRSKFLPQTGYEPSIKQKAEKQEVPIERTVLLYHKSLRTPLSNISSEKLALYERRRGELIHDILSRIEFVGTDIEESVSLVAEEIGGGWGTRADIVNVKALVLEFLRLPEIARFFAPAEDRRVMNEQEFVNPEGRLFRMDRVVVDTENVTVIDFKTGDFKDIYRDQINGYMAILRDFYPDRAVHGILAFVDRKKTQVIS
jgi:ATP-dependent helicase/nuclease subunit A